jgi:hypothetical protein
MHFFHGVCLAHGVLVQKSEVLNAFLPWGLPRSWGLGSFICITRSPAFSAAGIRSPALVTRGRRVRRARSRRTESPVIQMTSRV